MAVMDSHVVVVIDLEWVMATISDRAAPMVTAAGILRDSDWEVVVNSDQVAATNKDRAMTMAIGSGAEY